MRRDFLEKGESGYADPNSGYGAFWDIKTPYGGGRVEADNKAVDPRLIQREAAMATPPKKYTPEEIAANRKAMLDRVRGGTEEQVAVKEQGQRNKYRAFLADRGEDPDTIGGARLQRTLTGGERPGDWQAKVLSDPNEVGKIDREYVLEWLKREQSTPSAMAVPTVKEEFDAVNAGNQFAGFSNRLSIAAKIARDKGMGDIYAELLNERDNRRNSQGSSSEARKRYWMDRLTGANAFRKNLSANGFATQ
jgi:hypothetical protein